MDPVKYVLEAFAIALVSKVIMKKSVDMKEVLLLTGLIVATLLLLDLLAPSIGSSVRSGAGMSIGLDTVGVSLGPGPLHTPAGGQEGGGPYGLQAALGLQRTLNGEVHVPHMPHTVGQTGGGLQAALGLQRTLNGEAHVPHPLTAGQTGGGGLQAALGLQRTLNGEAHVPMTGGGSEGPAPYSEDPAGAPLRDRLGHTTVLHSLKPESGLREGMDDPVAIDYYSNGFSLTGRAQPQHGIYGSLTAESLRADDSERVSELPQTDILDRLMFDSENVKKGRPDTQRGGNEAAPKSGSKKGLRTSGPLYSGELIRIVAENGARLMIPRGSSKVQARNAILDDILFKLRFVLPMRPGQKESSGRRKIPYGATVHLVFTDETGQDRPLNHVDNLNSLKSKSGREFRIVSKEGTQGDVVLGTEVYVQTDDNAYLRVGESEVTSGPKDKATVFKLHTYRGCGPLWRYSRP